MLKKKLNLSPFRSLLNSSVEDNTSIRSHSGRNNEIFAYEKIFLSKNIVYYLSPIKNLSEKYQWKLVLSVSQNNRYRRILHISSKGSRATFLDFLFSKWLFSTLSEEEFYFFLLHPESTDNDLYYSALRAHGEGIDKRTIYGRYKSYCKLFQKEVKYTAQKYKSLQGKVLVSLYERNEELPEATKYSGYTKGPVDYGTLRTNSIVAELIEAENYDKKEFSLYKFFVVPVPEWFSYEVQFSADDSKDDETGDNNSNPYNFLNI